MVLDKHLIDILRYPLADAVFFEITVLLKSGFCTRMGTRKKEKRMEFF